MQTSKIVVIFLLLLNSFFSKATDYKVCIEGKKVDVFYGREKVCEYKAYHEDTITDAKYHEGFLFVFLGDKKPKIVISRVCNINDEPDIGYYPYSHYFCYKRGQYDRSIINKHFGNGTVCVRLKNNKNIIFCIKNKGRDNSSIGVFKCKSKNNIVYSKFDKDKDKCRLNILYENGVKRTHILHFSGHGINTLDSAQGNKSIFDVDINELIMANKKSVSSQSRGYQVY